MVIWTNEALLLKNKSTLCLIWIFFGRMRNFLVCRLKFDIVYDDVNNQCVFAMSPFHLHCRVWYDWLPRYAFLMLLYVIMKSIVCVHCRKVLVFILSVISIFQKKHSSIFQIEVFACGDWILNTIFLVWEILRIR